MKTKQIIMLFVALFISFITFACSGEKKSENAEASCTAVESVSADEDIATEVTVATKEESTTVSTSSSSSSTSSSSSSDWDRVLDKFESYTDNYISLLKKAQAGDIDAMTEYIDMMEEAQELADELEDAQGDLTSAQLSRYMRIVNKMTNAAMSM